MFFKRFSFALLFGLLLIIGFAGMRRQSGYAQGFEQGYAAAAQDFAAEPAAPAVPAVPAAPAGQSAPAAPYRPVESWGVFGAFAQLIKCLVMFAAIALFMKLLFFGCHRHWKGHKHGHWSHHQHKGKWGHHHQQWPHRPQKGDDDYEKQPEDVEPDVRSY